MGYILWSYHIRNNGVEKLQSITWDNDKWQELLFKKLRHLSVQEIFVLNTCNRIEVLVYHSKPTEMIPHLVAGLNCAIYSDVKEIINHMIEVSLSMDSMVFGENQILGQIKNAYISQSEKNFIGPELSKLLQLVLREAKSIRSKTSLSRIQTSVPAVAVKWIQKTFPDKKTSILLVGFGKTNAIVLKCLESKDYKNISLTNRTLEKIESLPYKTISWKSFVTKKLSPFDIICFATSSEKKLLTEDILKITKPKAVIDICIPANASSTLVTKHGAHYLGLDELQNILKTKENNLTDLRKELKLQMEHSVKTVYLELSLNSLNMFITKSVMHSEKIKDDAQKDLDSLLTKLTEDQKESLISWTSKLVKKLNHHHLTSYKEAFRIGLKSNGQPEDT